MEEEYEIWHQGENDDDDDQTIDHGQVVIEEIVMQKGHDHLDDLIEEVDEDDEQMNEEYLVGEEIIPSSEIGQITNSLDQLAAENLIYMAHDGNAMGMGDLIEKEVEQTETANYNEPQYFDCQVTEEVITDDWVTAQNVERIEMSNDQLTTGTVVVDGTIAGDMDVPLPTDQDEYTSSRPYPCDFCSRRFRKKTNLENHMVAHRTDRQCVCHLCGRRYARRNELINHLKFHAQMPADEEDVMNESMNMDIYHVISNTTSPSRGRNRIKVEREPRQRTVSNNVSVHNEQDDMQVLLEAAQQHDELHRFKTEAYPQKDPKKPFVCQSCGIGFAREKALISHSKIHGSDTPLECESCNEMFWDRNALREHQKTHDLMPDDASSNSEYEPEKDTSRPDDSESDTNAGRAFSEVYCDICGSGFLKAPQLRKHMRSAHPPRFTTSAEGHCCTVCGHTFTEALDLLAHAEIHARNQRYTCNLCGEIFGEENEIKAHLQAKHAAEMTDNTCLLCGKHCRDSRMLMKHSWDHSREKNHPCSKCGKTFHNKARLKRHMQSHRNKSVHCDVCGEEFPDGRSLMNHRHSHNNVSGRQFPCRECGKTFGSRSSQQIHMRIHTGERPYACRFCWKAFADGGTLRKHERIHTGEKPYACPVCPRAFNQRVVLREHIRSHHSGPDQKYGSSAAPYHCTVCLQNFSSSLFLIQDLIQHSDNNTAEQRQPPAGPRKYKRRRQLKPHEIERLKPDKQESDFSENEYEEERQTSYKIVEVPTPPPAPLPPPKRKYNRESATSKRRPSETKTTPTARITTTAATTSSTSNKRSLAVPNQIISENYNAVIDNVENTLQSIDSLVVPTTTHAAVNQAPAQLASPPAPPANITQQRATRATAATRKSKKNDAAARPKMIHTEKRRVATDEGSKRRTKTLITRTDVGREKKATRTTTRRSRAAAAATATTTAAATSSATAINNASSGGGGMLMDDNILEELSNNKLMNYSPDLVNDLEQILRSPIKKPRSQLAATPSPLVSHVKIKTEPIEKMKPPPPQIHPRQQRYSRRYNAVVSPKTTVASTFKNYDSNSDEQGEESDGQSINLKSVIKVEREMCSDDPIDTINSKEFIQCALCAAIFSDRTQLLLHVPIHI